MKDVTSTSFGLVIAFLLPGLAALFTFAFWSEEVRGILTMFLDAQSDAGLFLLVLLSGLALGLVLAPFRSLLFRKVICRSLKLSPSEFEPLADQQKLSAFRATVDEHYRYHQFWGAMALVFPAVFVGWITHLDTWSLVKCGILASCFAVVEVLTIKAASEELELYVVRARAILRGGKDGERMGQASKEEDREEEDS